MRGRTERAPGSASPQRGQAAMSSLSTGHEGPSGHVEVCRIPRRVATASSMRARHSVEADGRSARQGCVAAREVAAEPGPLGWALPTVRKRDVHWRPVFDSLQTGSRPPSARSAAAASSTRTRSPVPCARSVSRCSRQTSTSSVVKEFVAKVRERALGADVTKSLTPGQEVVRIVHEELTSLMGSGDSKLAFASKPPTVILLAGLQGAGKTTASAKLALLLRKDGHSPALVAADLARPAAVDQLQQLGRSSRSRSHRLRPRAGRDRWDRAGAQAREGRRHPRHGRPTAHRRGR